MAWSIRFHKEFLFCLFLLPILLLPIFFFIWNSHASFFNFPRFFVFFSLPLFYPAVNLSKLIEHSPNITVNSLLRGLLGRQQAADLYFLLHSMGMQQIWPAVPWRVLALLNHFAQWCSGLAPNFLSLKLLCAVCWRDFLAREFCIPLPPSPAPTLQFEPTVEKKYSFYCFVLLLVCAHQCQQIQGSRCPLPWLVAVSQCCII